MLGRPHQVSWGSAAVPGGPRHVRRLAGCMGRAPALSLSLPSVCGYYTEDEAIGLFSTLIYGNGGLVTTTKKPSNFLLEPVKRA